MGLSGTLIKIAFAAGGAALVAVLVIVAIVMAGDGGDEDTLLADAFAGHPTQVIVGGGSATVWATAPDFRADPRPNGEPDPSLCTVSGSGDPVLVDPTASDTRSLGDSTLYLVAQVEDYAPPMEIICSGGNLDHVYVTGSPDPA